MKKRRCLIIGASGFLGSNLQQDLKEDQEFEIVACDSRTVDLRQHAQIGDLIAAQKPDIIVNVAGISSPASSDISNLYAVNSFGHMHILEAASKLKHQSKVILASSAQLYGPGVMGKAAESTPLNPVSHYALSKLLAEKYSELFAEGLPTVTVRIYNAIGRNQSEQFLIPKIVAAFRDRRSYLEIGSADVERDYIDVRDLNQMWRLVMHRNDTPKIVNFSNGETATVRDIIARLTALTGHQLEIRYNTKILRKNDIPYQCGDSSIIRSLGYRRRFSLDDTLLWMLKGQ